MSFLLHAPIIVVGTVGAVKEIGQPRPAQFDSRIHVQLNEIALNTEMVLRGNMKPSPVRLRYFAFSNTSTIDLGRPRFIPAEGARRVFFLDETDGSYRSVGDVLDYPLLIPSGYYAPEFCAANVPPGCCIAKMLMTPGRDRNEDFVARLGESLGQAETLCSKQEADTLLNALASSDDDLIAKRARYYLRSILKQK